MAEKLLKGSRVVATGNLEQHQYTDGEGNERISVELSVDEIGSSLRYAEKAATPARRPAASSGKPASNGTAKKQYARSSQGSRSPQTVGGGR